MICFVMQILYRRRWNLLINVKCGREQCFIYFSLENLWPPNTDYSRRGRICSDRGCSRKITFTPQMNSEQGCTGSPRAKMKKLFGPKGKISQGYCIWGYIPGMGGAKAMGQGQSKLDRAVLAPSSVSLSNPLLKPFALSNVTAGSSPSCEGSQFPQARLH